MDVIRLLFGDGTELTTWQMADRALVTFVLALAMIRLAGRRSFGQRSPFDACTTVLLGAVLSRAVVGASPFSIRQRGGTSGIGAVARAVLERDGKLSVIERH